MERGLRRNNPTLEDASGMDIETLKKELERFTKKIEEREIAIMSELKNCPYCNGIALQSICDGVYLHCENAGIHKDHLCFTREYMSLEDAAKEWNEKTIENGVILNNKK